MVCKFIHKEADITGRSGRIEQRQIPFQPPSESHRRQQRYASFNGKTCHLLDYQCSEFVGGKEIKDARNKGEKAGDLRQRSNQTCPQ